MVNACSFTLKKLVMLSKFKLSVLARTAIVLDVYSRAIVNLIYMIFLLPYIKKQIKS
jgi:hypothetical protein